MQGNLCINVGAQSPGQSALVNADNNFLFGAKGGGFTKIVVVNKAGTVGLKQIASRNL
jgi:hypothetical protein